MTADRTVRTAILATAVVAVVVLASMAAIGRLRAGLALDLGLVIGAANGPMIQRSLRLGMGFGALSMVRLLVLSVVAVRLGVGARPRPGLVGGAGGGGGAGLPGLPRGPGGPGA